MDKPSPTFVNEFTVKVNQPYTLKYARRRLLAASAQLAALRALPDKRRARAETLRYAEFIVLGWHDRVWALQQSKEDRWLNTNTPRSTRPADTGR